MSLGGKRDFFSLEDLEAGGKIAGLSKRGSHAQRAASGIKPPDF